jgi:Tfp pilus assembly protein FimV
MAKLDKALAPKSTTSQPAKGTEVNPAAEDQAATPIVETAAATLAALGFGGLAYWTRRVSKAWQQAHGEQCQAHADLQSQVDALKPARPALPLSPRIIGDSNNGPGLQTDQ